MLVFIIIFVQCLGKMGVQNGYNGTKLYILMARTLSTQLNSKMLMILGKGNVQNLICKFISIFRSFGCSNFSKILSFNGKDTIQQTKPFSKF